jgi:methanogenic corrinoid protein MtbC1
MRTDNSSVLRPERTEVDASKVALVMAVGAVVTAGMLVKIGADSAAGFFTRASAKAKELIKR